MATGLQCSRPIISPPSIHILRRGSAKSHSADRDLVIRLDSADDRSIHDEKVSYVEYFAEPRVSIVVLGDKDDHVHLDRHFSHAVCHNAVQLSEDM